MHENAADMHDFKEAWTIVDVFAYKFSLLGTLFEKEGARSLVKIGLNGSPYYH